MLQFRVKLVNLRWQAFPALAREKQAIDDARCSCCKPKNVIVEFNASYSPQMHLHIVWLAHCVDWMLNYHMAVYKTVVGAISVRGVNVGCDDGKGDKSQSGNEIYDEGSPLHGAMLCIKIPNMFNEEGSKVLLATFDS